MLNKISKKRLAKGEKLCWNSTIKAKTYTLKKSPLKKVSDKQAKLWSEAREKCLDIWGHKCFLCGSTKNLHCHHWMFTRSQAPEHKYNQNNLIILCSKCHSHNGADAKFYELRSRIWTKLLIEKEIKERVKFDFSDIEARNKFIKAFSDELTGIEVDNENFYSFVSGDIKEIKFNKDTNKVEILLQPSEPKQIKYSINLKQGE